MIVNKYIDEFDLPLGFLISCMGDKWRYTWFAAPQGVSLTDKIKEMIDLLLRHGALINGYDSDTKQTALDILLHNVVNIPTHRLQTDLPMYHDICHHLIRNGAVSFDHKYDDVLSIMSEPKCDFEKLNAHIRSITPFLLKRVL
jgi:hypothetical protein